MWRGASGSCSHRIALPSGQRDGSSACGWPTQMVGTSGSRPRTASLQALETRRQMQQRNLVEALAAPGRRLVESVVYLEIALAVAIAARRVGLTFWGRVAEQPAVKLRRCDRADDAFCGVQRLPGDELDASSATAALDDRGGIGVDADLAAAFPDQ